MPAADITSSEDTINQLFQQSKQIGLVPKCPSKNILVPVWLGSKFLACQGPLALSSSFRSQFLGEMPVAESVTNLLVRQWIGRAAVGSNQTST